MLKLEDVVNILKSYCESGKESDSQAFEKLKLDLIIKSYVPIGEKIAIVYKSLLENNLDIDTIPAFFVGKIVISLFFNGLLYYTNIDLEDSQKYNNFENYDLFYTSGLADFILSYCQKDFDRLTSLLKETLNFANVEKLVEALSAIDTNNIQNLINEFTNFQNQLDPKVIENISDIVRYNDPELYKLNTNVVEDILDKLDYIDKKNK